jgi:serine protease AprX
MQASTTPANPRSIHVLEARSWGQNRNGLVALVVTGLVLLAFATATPTGATAEAARRPMSLVVRAVPGAVDAAEAAVIRLGGRIGRELSIIDGFAATVPGGALAQLRDTQTIVSATPDTHLQPMAGSYDPVTDVGSPYNTTAITGAQQYWKAGYTGKGVDVALIDSGVAPVDGLTTPGKVINGPDLSFESQATNLRYLDSYGHGTHMAGLIAGLSSDAASSKDYTNPSSFVGMAPDARILSMKVADAYGATDVSQVIAAIDWVVQHRNDNGMDIRVLNLSYGTDSSQSYLVDPLAFAAEQAWKAGIVVVAAAGNAGFAKGGTLTNPAYDPTLLAIGAADTRGTLRIGDDVAADFSANALSGTTTGTGKRGPDLIAPGVHMVSLRDAGSTIDKTYGSTGAVSATLFRGSGTSQAAAVTSGAVALLLQQRPELTPDQVKRILMATAAQIGGNVDVRGAGELNLAALLNAPTPAAAGDAAPSTGTGTLEGSRGSVHLEDNGVVLAGEQDIFGSPFDSAAMAQLEAAGKSWSGGVWNGKSWSGSDWSGKSWSGSSWSGKSWSGCDWAGKSWSSMSWSKASWSAKGWSGTWTAKKWLDASWAQKTWAGAYWK